MEMKNILPYQRSLFVLGDVGAERYELFRSFASSKANLERYWHPRNDVFKQCTWVLFSSDEPLCYEWTKKGIREFSTIQAGRTYFLSVSPGQIPLNVKLVFPPYFTNEESFKAYFEESSFVNNASAYIWFEGFPYGKADTVKQLRYLQEIDVSKKQISVAITQIERDFVVSDIGSIEVGIRNAKKYFLNKGYRILQDYAVIPLQRSIMLEALNVESNYVEKIIANKQEVLKNIQASLIFIEDDLPFALERNQWILKLEQCFAFTHIRKNNIYEAWIQQLKALFKNELVTVVQQELNEAYNLNEIHQAQAIEKDLRSISDVLWNELERKFKILRRQKALTTHYTTQVDYELKTRELKVKFYDYINDTVQRRLPTEIQRYLENIINKYLVIA